MYEYSSMVYEPQYFILRAFNNPLRTTLYSRLVFCVFFSFAFVKPNIPLSENSKQIKKKKRKQKKKKRKKKKK